MFECLLKQTECLWSHFSLIYLLQCDHRQHFESHSKALTNLLIILLLMYTWVVFTLKTKLLEGFKEIRWICFIIAFINFIWVSLITKSCLRIENTRCVIYY
uniref:Uncharacterized protein n=1 Tax=Cacopsylla melanoneura TaxID=428564 RepID=A0A8D8UKG8_9HEMI